MNFDISKLSKTIGAYVKEHSPEILTGVGLVGMVSSTVLAVTATPKAMRLIDDKKEQLEIETGEEVLKLSKKMVVRTVWKCYIPAFVTGSLSAACIIGGVSTNTNKNIALATAYALSEANLKKYKDAVVESIGEKKEKEIRDKVAQGELSRNPISNREVIMTDNGTTLCFDSISGRYFKSDANKIRKAMNEINRRLLTSDYVSLNDFYYEIGLDGTKLGDDLGWRVDDGEVDFYFTSLLAQDDTPCLVIDYTISPRYEYDKYF